MLLARRHWFEEIWTNLVYTWEIHQKKSPRERLDYRLIVQFICQRRKTGWVIAEKAAKCERVMVILVSNHTHEHVLGELNLYASLVSVGSYCVVFDTVIEDLEGVEFVDRPWGKGNNPKTAVAEFLKTNSDFVVDQAIDEKLLISVAPGGYLKRIK